MPRKLKTYQTSIGFFDLAIAAPSMKAAADAWGAKTDVFRRGSAKQVDDPEVVAATMAKPGVILKRPVGSSGPFTEDAELPKDLPDKTKSSFRQPRSKAKKPAARKSDAKADRKAELAFKKEQKRREEARKKEEAAREKERRRREQEVAKVESALEAAKDRHDAKAKDIEGQRAALENRSKAEDARWEKQRKKLEASLRRARD